MSPTPTTPTTATSRRGRPRAGESAQRREKVMASAFDELIEKGYDRVTMLGIAQRAGASKETLYSWFGSRDGLFAAMITANADDSAERVTAALDEDADPIETLTSYSIGLLTLLTGDRSVALNRASMTSPDLAAILLDAGRHRIGPLVERYLAHLAASGFLQIDDPADAFTLLYGLVVRDIQIRVLLGESPPTPAEIGRRATSAVDVFVTLMT